MHMDTYREQANLLRLMGHPMRLQILDLLRSDDECVCHLSAVLDKPQPYVSQQLAVLRNAGLIVDRKAGTHVYYGLANGRTGQQVRSVLRGPAGDTEQGHCPGHQQIAGCCCPRCSAESCARDA
jgi:DNA-binding transcriptional ArsR family regulator